MRNIVRGCLILFAAYSYVFAGSIYYVDAVNGNDQNTGLSPASAWRTIQKVNNSMSSFNAGDSILFRRGDTWDMATDSDLSITKGGSSGNYITFGSYGTGNKPKFVCASGITADLISFTKNGGGINYVCIRDLELSKTGGSNGNGITITSNSTGWLTNWVIDNITVSASINCGIVVANINTYSIRNCLIYNTNLGGISIGGSPAYKITNGLIENTIVHNVGPSDGVTLHRDGNNNDIGSNHQIMNNVLYNCGEQGLDLTSGDNIVARHNETYNNNEGGVVVDWGTSNVWIDKHYSHDEKFGVILGKSTRVKLTSSIIYNSEAQSISISDCRDLEAYNNTIVRENSNPFIDIGAGTDNITFKNNIIALTLAGTDTRLVRYLSGTTPINTHSQFDYNIWWAANPPDSRLWWDGLKLVDFSQWQSDWGQEAHSFFRDPKLKDIGQKNFRLSPDSPAIDSGSEVGLTSDFEGTIIFKGFAPDSGAYEYVRPIYIRANASPTLGIAPLTVNFSSQVLGSHPPFAYDWSFGDSQSSLNQNPTHTYVSTGNYTAKLTITDSQRNADFKTMDIKVVSSLVDYQLSLSASTGPPASGQGGTTNPSPGNHAYKAGDLIEINANPNINYRFSRWDGDVVSQDKFRSKLSLFMDKNKALTANFCSKCGDVNGDLAITPSDAQRAFDIFLGKISNPTICETENADVNSDGSKSAPKVTPIDAQLIFEKYLQKIDLPSDCGGSSRTASLYFRKAATPGAEIMIDEVSAGSRKEIVIPVFIQADKEINAFGFDLSFPSNVLKFSRLESSGREEGFYQIGTNEMERGILRVGGYQNPRSVEKPSAALIYLVFKVKGKPRGTHHLIVLHTFDDVRYASVRSAVVFQEKGTLGTPNKRIDSGKPTKNRE